MNLTLHIHYLVCNSKNMGRNGERLKIKRGCVYMW